MSNQNFEGQPEGDWDDRGDLSWNEFDWRQFLLRHEDELIRFNGLYAEHKHHPGRLDEVAHLMGWDPEDWSVSDIPDDDEASTVGDRRDPDDQREEDVDPYTVHRHPVYVVVSSLYRDLRHLWESISETEAATRDPALVWDYAKAIHAGECNVILAVNALDMGDYALAVCQMKFGLAAINDALNLLPRLIRRVTPEGKLFTDEVRLRLFDLREVCLRVMSDCREEIRRTWGDRGQGHA